MLEIYDNYLETGKSEHKLDCCITCILQKVGQVSNLLIMIPSPSETTKCHVIADERD